MKHFGLLFGIVFTFSILHGLHAQKRIHYSQSPKVVNKKVDEWHEGTIYMTSGDTIKGEFSINPLVQGGLVKVKSGEKLIAITPAQLNHIDFYWPGGLVKRYIESWGKDTDHPFIVEILYENEKVKLISIQSLSTLSLFYLDNGSRYSAVNKDSRVLIVMDEELKEFNRKSFKKVSGTHYKEVLDYKIAHQLRYQEPSDARLILSYLDFLIAQESN